MPLLEKDFRIYAVGLRGQGRSSRTPGRYTVDNMGNDLVRFIQTAIGKATIVAGLSSGGVLSCWLSAYAPPGLIRGAYYEAASIFSSEVTPACGFSIRQGAYSILFLRSGPSTWAASGLWGNWKGMIAAAAVALPQAIVHLAPKGHEPPQNL